MSGVGVSGLGGGIEERIGAELVKHRFERWSIASADANEWWGHCTGCGYEAPSRSGHVYQPEWELNMRDDEARHVAAVLAEAIQPPRVETVEQLDALPHRALVVREYTSQAGWHLNEVWEKRNDNWFCVAAPLIPPGEHWGTPTLPALLVYTPPVVSTEQETR